MYRRRDQMGSRREGLLYNYIRYKNDLKGVGELCSFWGTPVFLHSMQVCWKQELGRRHGVGRHRRKGSLSNSRTRGVRNTASSGRPHPFCSFADGHPCMLVVPRITRKKGTEREEKM